MPVDKSKYPSNWKQLATQIKESANWTCQECRRPCRKPGETWHDFLIRPDLAMEWLNQSCEEVFSDDDGMSTVIDKPQRFTLTVAHLDHDTTNNHPDNLKALCSGCHLRYDAPLHRRNASATRDRKRQALGQTTLF
jgi:5-methylcytosine-specific restriction endonuclease McrA